MPRGLVSGLVPTILELMVSKEEPYETRYIASARARHDDLNFEARGEYEFKLCTTWLRSQPKHGVRARTRLLSLLQGGDLQNAIHRIVQAMYSES